MHKHGQRCTGLIEATANALSGGAVALILLAIQKGNLELNITRAVKWAQSTFQRGGGSTERVIKLCILAFPSIWYPEAYTLAESETFRRETEELESIQWWIDNKETETPQFFFDGQEDASELFFKLNTFFAKPPLLISSDDNNSHHNLIVTILILEHASLLYASQSKSTRDEALDRACSRYSASGVHSEVTEQFFAPPTEYSTLQFTEFILKHRL